MWKNKVSTMLVGFVLRALIGLTLIYIVNIYIAEQGVGVNVGMNVISFLTSGFLGIPGVAMLYGIGFYQIM